MDRREAEAAVRALVAARAGYHDLSHVPVRLDVLRALVAPRACAAGFVPAQTADRDACARCGLPMGEHPQRPQER